MRLPMLCLLAVLAGSGPDAAWAAATADLPALEQAWHGCVREAYARQPNGRSRAGAQRSALDECRAGEDAYVAAAMTARSQEDSPLSARALAWASSVAASVVDPVAGWIARLQR